MALISGYVTYGELSTTLSVEDLYDIVEVYSVDAYNHKVVEEYYEKKNAR